MVFWDVLSEGPGETGLTGPPDETLILRRLTTLLDVYRAADAIRRPTDKKALSQWKIGLYSAFILHSLIITEGDVEGWAAIRATWIQFLARSRETPALENRLFSGTTKSCNITYEKCERIHKNIRDMMDTGFQLQTEMVDEEDDEYDDVE